MPIGYFNDSGTRINVESLSHMTFIYLAHKRGIKIRTGQFNDMVVLNRISKIPDFIATINGVEHKIFLILDNSNRKRESREIAILTDLRNSIPNIHYALTKKWRGFKIENLAWLGENNLYIHTDQNPFTANFYKSAEPVEPAHLHICKHVNSLLNGEPA